MDFSLPNMWEQWDEWPKFYKAMYFVSMFYHGLNEEEFIAAPFVYYGGAKKDGLLDQYYPVEEAFLTLFERLIGEETVLFNRSRWNRGCITYKIKRFKGFGSQVKKLIRDEVREQGGCGDIYIPHLHLRVLFDFDLTHGFFFEDEDLVGSIMQTVNTSGLHAFAPSKVSSLKMKAAGMCISFDGRLVSYDAAVDN